MAPKSLLPTSVTSEVTVGIAEPVALWSVRSIRFWVMSPVSVTETGPGGVARSFCISTTGSGTTTGLANEDEGSETFPVFCEIAMVVGSKNWTCALE
ncbi:hypothetical protein D3C86_2069900 [compost metagenome]